MHVKQFPKLSVKTKFGKHPATYLLDIPDLLGVVKDWDNEVRSILPNNGKIGDELSKMISEYILNTTF